jgi:anti-sigma regulatory factor (Ser/Thr protein kinase)
MALRIVVFSSDQSDYALAESVAGILSATVHVQLERCPSNRELTNLLATSLQTILIWNIDNAEQEAVDSARVISQFIPPERVFAISAKQIKSTSPLVSSNVFGHFFMRTEDQAFSQVIARIIFACSMKGIPAIASAFAEGGSLNEIELVKSAHRKPAIQALQNILQKRELPDRICKKVAKATDELLLNAFHRAPRDAQGKAYLAEASNITERELNEAERVDLQFFSHKDFLAICVRDQFGSLERKNVQFQFTRDYTEIQYSLKQGLGIFQSFHGGLSLMFMVRPGKETRGWIIVPWVKSFRDFQSSFHFFSFVFQA